MRYHILVVEDDSKRITDFIEFLGFHDLCIVDSVFDAKVHLKSDMFDYVFLDGDLGSALNGNGTEVAQYIRDYLNYSPEVIVHSWDLTAAEKILRVLVSAQHIAFGTEEFYSIQIGENYE